MATPHAERQHRMTSLDVPTAGAAKRTQKKKNKWQKRIVFMRRCRGNRTTPVQHHMPSVPSKLAATAERATQRAMELATAPPVERRGMIRVNSQFCALSGMVARLGFG